MGITQIPQQIAAPAGKAVQGFKERVGDIQWNGVCWTRAVAVGSVITGAILLARGQRKAGAAVTAAGAILGLLEDPKDARAVWHSIPGYLDSGRRLIGRVEDFIEELSAQGEKFRQFLENAQS